MNNYIFDIVEKENLSEMLKAFNSSTGIATYLMSKDGEIIIQYGPTYPYCTFVYSHIPESLCHKARVDAGIKAMEIGSAYIFSCHANLNHIAFPIINKGEFFGSIQVGPFLMEKPDSSLVMKIGEKYKEFSMKDLMILYDDAADIPLVSTEQVTQLSKLFYYLMSSLIVDSKERFIINQKKFNQQSKISSSVHKYKNQEDMENIRYPIEMEKRLVSLIKEHDDKGAVEVLNELLGYLLAQNGSHIGTIRNRALEIGSIIVHTALDNSNDTKDILHHSDKFIMKVPDIVSFEELCFAMEDLLESVMECCFLKGNESNKVVQKVMNYVLQNYDENLTLNEAAEHVALNPAYLSRVFKKISGLTFKEYLNSVRIEEAKRLLLNTDYSIIDIAIATGFESQSYFSQCFKKHVGISPNKFRK